MGEQAERERALTGGTGVTVAREGAVAIWTLDRPERRNALSRALVRELGRLAREAAGDPTLRAVVLTGAGDKAFCAGADLKERRTMDEDDVRDFLPRYRASFGALSRLPVPVVAALNGVAFGGGLELALACDFRVATASARLGLTEVSIGIIPGAGGIPRLARIVGEAKAKELVLFAKRLSAAEAHELGIVTHLTEGSALEAARALVAPLEAAAPVAVAAALEVLRRVADVSLEEALTLERAGYDRCLVTADRLEGLAAFAEKRKPVYRGE
jgi:methylglutaconyl-CoA hydratase